MRRNVIDRLALLCTLHADGPKTLRLLREAGCTSLEKLRDIEPNRLAKILSLAPAAARRLLREVAQLEERLEPALEREEVMYPPASEAGAVKPALPGSLRIGTETRESERPPRGPHPLEGGVQGDLGVRDRELLERVVDRWRRADDDSPAAGPSAMGSFTTMTEASDEGAVEKPAPPPLGLRPGQIGGLDAEACESLRRGAITSLEELATCPIDELVERTGLSFTRARTFQFLAGRRLSRSAAEPTAPASRAEEPQAPLPVPSPVLRSAPVESRGEPPEEGAGGPFA